MSEKRAKRKRLHERVLTAERENEQLANLLLLHKPPLRCRIKRLFCGARPSAVFCCEIGQHLPYKPRRCAVCGANLRIKFDAGCNMGLYGDLYPLALAKAVQRIYEEEK